MESYKQEKIIIIMYEYLNDKREFYPISNVPLDKAKFFYKDDDGLFKLMAVSDYTVKTELNENRLYIVNAAIKDNSEKFQIGYEINFKAAEYESPLPVLSVLTKMYNQLIEDTRILHSYIRKQCFVADGKEQALVLPNLPSYTVWCMGENGKMFALPVSELYERFGKLIKAMEKILDEYIEQKKEEIRGPAGAIDNVTASVNSNAGTPKVTVSLGGTPERRKIDLKFENLKGDKPIKGTDYYTEEEKQQFTNETLKLVTDEGNKVVEQVKTIVAGNPATTNALTLSGKTRIEFEKDTQALVGKYNGNFPLTSAVKGAVYLVPSTGKFYFCKEAYNGENLNEPNKENFEELSVFKVNDKIINLKKAINALTNIKVLNGFDKSNISIDNYFNQNGVLSPSIGWTASLSYSVVEPNITLYSKSTSNFPLEVKVVWYDENKNFIKQESGNMFTSPKNASFFRVCCVSQYTDVLVLGNSNVVDKYIPYGFIIELDECIESISAEKSIKQLLYGINYIDSIAEFYSSEFIKVTLRNGFDKSNALDGHYIDNKGNVTPTTGWCCNEKYIHIKPNTTYHALSYLLNIKDKVIVAWYDKRMQFISTSKNDDFISPSNALFARVSCALTVKDTFVFTEKEKQTAEYWTYGYEKSVNKDVNLNIDKSVFPVTSVNGQTGDVVLDMPEAIESVQVPKLIISKAVHRSGIKNSYSTPESDYVTFKDIYPVFDVGFNTTGAVYALAEHLVNAKTQGVYKSLDGGEHWEKLGDLEIDQANGVWYNSIFVEPFQETIYTIKVTNGYNEPIHNFIESFDNRLSKLGSMDIGVARMLSGVHSIDACISKDYTKRVVIFGEYALEDAKTVRLWRTTDKGISWQKVMEKTANNGVVNSGEIRHFHAVCCDPYTFDWWACSGDGDHQCKIWRSQDDGLTWHEMFSNGQKYRTLQFVFEKDCIYYAMDSTTASTHPFTKLFRIDRSTMEVKEVADIKNNFAVYNITRTFIPEGLIIWSCNENHSSVEANSVTIQFFDYKTQTIKDIYNFPFHGVKNTYRGFQAGSRYQDMESGNVFFMPTLKIGQLAYGSMGTCSRYFKAKITI